MNLNLKTVFLWKKRINDSNNNSTQIKNHVDKDEKINIDEINRYSEMVFLDKNYVDVIVKDIIRSREFVLIKLLLECIENFKIKFNEFVTKLGADFLRLYSKFKNYFNSINIEFYNDIIGFTKRVKISLIII